MAINVSAKEARELALQVRGFTIQYYRIADRARQATDNGRVIDAYNRFRETRSNLQGFVSTYGAATIRAAFEQTFVEFTDAGPEWAVFLADYQNLTNTLVPAFQSICVANANTIRQDDFDGNYTFPLQDAAQAALLGQLQSALDDILAIFIP